MPLAPRLLAALLAALALGPAPALAASPAPAVAAAPGLPAPRQAFGFEPGDDRQLLDYEQLIAYLKSLDEASDRVLLREVGKSPEGRPMYVTFISAPENLARLDELRRINQRLALDPAIPAAERARLVQDGRVFVMEALSMHSTEVGPSQALPVIAHELATTQDPATLARLGQVVLMIVPCHNPDGMDMVVRWYRQQKGTPWEGANMPGLYHRYVGHDNNRDFLSLTQADTRVVSRLFSTEWYPQVLVEKHQMGATGPRYFVPPNHDPIAENVDEALWTWTASLGTSMARDMGADGLTGVVNHWAYDNYWPGSTETSVWKGVVSLLTEAASARLATPVWIEPNELSGRGKGLAEYKKGINMPAPWPGGWWRLRDLVTYERSSTLSLLRSAAEARQSLLTLRNDLTVKAVAQGRTQAPFHFVLPRRQHDAGALAELTRVLQEHGVLVEELSAPVTVAGRAFEAGDLVVPLAQPYRAFVKEVLEAQRYPERHYSPGGELIKPYDITSWSMALQAGLEVVTLSTRSAPLEAALRPLSAPPARPAVPAGSWGLAFTAAANDSHRAAWAALGKGLEVTRLRAPLEVDGRALPAGSFLVHGPADALAAVAGLTAEPPLPLGRAPAAPTVAVRRPRIGLVETWFGHADAGWTRWILDEYGIPFTLLRPGDLAAADLAKLDVLVFPSADRNLLVKGKYKEESEYRAVDLPPAYRKGLGKKGVEALVGFLERGGAVLAWGDAVGLFTDELRIKRAGEDDEETITLPVREVSEDRQKKKGLYVPGAWLKLEVRTDHPLTWGMQADAGAFSRGHALETSVPRQDTDRRVLARYGEHDLLLSGFIDHEEALAETPAVVWVRKGKGQLGLFAFSPQGRASTPATYKLLLNGLLLPPVE
jgi:hypothetical protein